MIQTYKRPKYNPFLLYTNKMNANHWGFICHGLSILAPRLALALAVIITWLTAELCNTDSVYVHSLINQIVILLFSGLIGLLCPLIGYLSVISNEN